MKVEQPPMRAGNLLPLDSNAGVRVAVFSGLLFFSGVGALIFETLWLRLSGLEFGNSIWAAALILSSFMAGLGLGKGVAAPSRGWRGGAPHFLPFFPGVLAVFCCSVFFFFSPLGGGVRPPLSIIF